MKKKVLLYGIEDRILSLVEMFLDEMSDNLSVHVARAGKHADLLHDYLDMDINYVIFVGSYPESEIKIARKMGAKILVIPFEEFIPTDVIVSSFNPNLSISSQIEVLKSDVAKFLRPDPGLRLVKVG